MRRLHYLIAAILLVVVFVSITGCIDTVPGERAQMLNTQPTETISHSVERDIFMGYLKECSDPNNIQWIYCMDYNGNVLFKSPVKGKTISATKSSEPYERIIDGSSADYGEISAARHFAGYIPGTPQLMNPSGMFGGDTIGVIWQDPQGNYYEYHSGPYFISSVPLNIDAPTYTTSIDQDVYAKEKKVESGQSNASVIDVS
jgi:hypothetical protein